MNRHIEITNYDDIIEEITSDMADALFEQLLAETEESSYKDKGEYDEDIEADRRSTAMFLGYYVENGPTYDPSGKYLCGSCAHRCDAGDHTDCILVVGPVSNTTGSCRLYEIGGESPHGNEMPVKYSQEIARYTERPNVKGFGCSRCKYGDKAEKEDKAGRKLWCSFWGMHVLPTSCCENNEGKDDVNAPSKGKESPSDDVDAEFEDLDNIAKGSPAAIQASAYVPKLEGFNKIQEKEIVKCVKRIPQKFLGIVTRIKADPDLGAIHGKYDPDTTTVLFNPKNFRNKTTFGTQTKVPADEFVLTHEIGHAIYTKVLSAGQQASWQKLSGWMKGTGSNQAPPYEEKRPGWPKKTSKWTHAKDAKFARLYSGKNPNEDFADHFAYYTCGNAGQVPVEKRNFLKALCESV